MSTRGAVAVLALAAACDIPHRAYDEEFNPHSPEPHIDRAAAPRAPELDTLGLDGTRLDLRSYEGRIVLVCFFTTRCTDCGRALGAVAALRRPGAVEMIAVSEDESVHGVRAFTSAAGASIPTVWDEGGRIAARWNVRTTPEIDVIDRRGVRRFVHGNEGADLAAELDELTKRVER